MKSRCPKDQLINSRERIQRVNKRDSKLCQIFQITNGLKLNLSENSNQDPTLKNNS
jgi:hypothetical protein